MATRYGFMNHVCDDHQFADGYFFFRFYVDTLSVDAGYTEFQRLEEGLLYLDHLNVSARSFKTAC